MCPSKLVAIQSKRHIIPLPSVDENLKSRVKSSGGRFVLFDIGASTYDAWAPPGYYSEPSAIGMKWFVEIFRRYKIEFDRIVAFEPVVELYEHRNIPPDLVSILFYI